MAARPRRTQPKYVDIYEAADLTGCCEKTIRRRISAGVIRGYRLGSGSKARIRIPVEDLDKLLRPIPVASGR